jgi:DNA ligase (NAD+)
MHNLNLVSYHKLVSELSKCAEAYYIHDAPVISDSEWDEKYKEIEEFEINYPGLKVTDSPTNYVGGSVSASVLPKVKRVVPMLSLDNTYSPDEITKWLKKFPSTATFVVAPKYDGLAVDISYVDGRLVQASTRGDGLIGEDVTVSARYVQGLPIDLEKKVTVNLRGEIYMSDEDFSTVSDEYIDPRNAAAGILRRLKPSEETKLLSFKPYGLLKEGEKNAVISATKLKDIKKLGVDVNGVVVKPSEVVSSLLSINVVYRKLGIPIDGGVVTVSDEATQEEFGYVNKAPRFSIAYKYETIKYFTKLLGVKLQTGRTGKITPVGILAPVKVGNVTVEKASFCNGPYMERLGAMIGDDVIIHRAGEVIPQVIGLYAKGKGECTPIPRITNCPSCDSKVSTRFNLDGTETVDVFCNNKECPAVLLRSLESHVSRTGANITGMGPSVIEKLVRAKYVNDIADIYNLTKEQLVLCGLGKKIANKVWGAIASAMEETPAANVICSLGIPDIGLSVSKDLVRVHKGVWDKDTLIEMLKTVGTDNMVQNVIDHKGPIDDVLGLFHTTSTASNIVNGVFNNIFKDRSVGITGSFGDIKRDHIVGLIEDCGGRFVSVGKKTDYVIVGDKAGQAKLDAISKYGIPTMSLEEVEKVWDEAVN